MGPSCGIKRPFPKPEASASCKLTCAECSDSLAYLTHLHVSYTDDEYYVDEIVLPPNLTYCFVNASLDLRRCTLPMSLTFFETKQSDLKLININNHPNLTILRMPNNVHYKTLPLVLPPNLIELSIWMAKADTIPPSLISFNFVHFDMPRKLSIGYIENANSSNSERLYLHVRDLVLGTLVTSNILSRMPTLFPKVVNLTLYSRGHQNKALPVFHLVQKLDLKLSEWSISEAVMLDNWTSLVELTLSWNSNSSNDICIVTKICLPEHLLKLKIRTSSKTNLHIQLPPLLTRACFESNHPVFTLSMCKDARLRTLRTRGNVFANRIKFPDSLRSFHITLRKDEPLFESWETLPKCVDFQVFRD